jgi:hypothetical protein
LVAGDGVVLRQAEVAAGGHRDPQLGGPGTGRNGALERWQPAVHRLLVTEHDPVDREERHASVHEDLAAFTGIDAVQASVERVDGIDFSPTMYGTAQCAAVLQGTNRVSLKSGIARRSIRTIAISRPSAWCLIMPQLHMSEAQTKSRAIHSLSPQLWAGVALRRSIESSPPLAAISGSAWQYVRWQTACAFWRTRARSASAIRRCVISYSRSASCGSSAAGRERPIQNRLDCPPR